MTAVLLVLLLTLLNGVFSGAEIAVLSVRKTRLAELHEERRRGASAVLWLRHQPERFLATVQVGLTLVSTAAAAFGGEELAGQLAARLARVPGVGAWAPRLALALVVVAIAFANIVLGELVPKSLALRSAEGYALWSGPLLRRLASVLRPIVWLLTASSNALLRLFGDRTSFTEARLSPEELQELVEEAARVGSLDAKTSEIASRALDFRELRAVDVLVPRGSIAALPLDATREQALAKLAARPYRRMPVYDGASDNYVGYVSSGELLLAAASAGEGAGTPFALAPLLRPVRFVPESTLAVELLRSLQGDRSPLALVVDETGGVTGLLTVEDLLEELVGDIASEYEAAAPTLAWGADGTAVVPAQTPVREVNRALDLALPEGPGYSTVAGLSLQLAGKIPTTGAVLTTPDGATLEVLDATPRKVRTVRVRAPAPRPDGLDGEGEEGEEGQPSREATPR